MIDHGGRTDINSYGGVAGFTTFHKGPVGCVIDGVTRDIDEYKELSLPVYSRGFIQQSIRNRCACAGYQIPNTGRAWWRACAPRRFGHG